MRKPSRVRRMAKYYRRWLV